MLSHYQSRHFTLSLVRKLDILSLLMTLIALFFGLNSESLKKQSRMKTSSLKTMEFMTVGAVLFILSLFLPSSESVYHREHAVHNFNSTNRKVMPKRPYIKAQPEDTNQELCFCIGDVCFYCPDGLFCNIDESGCCPFPGCHDECGDLCVCPEYPVCCDDKGTCPATTPVCCDLLPFCCPALTKCCDLQPTCCPIGTDCCGSTLCCNKATEDCCQDSKGNYYCGQC